MRHRFYTADVFTETIFGGNPLAVFPDAGGIEPEQMQRVAREFNLSETVFVLPPRDPESTRRLRIFTPSSEMPFAGHPTLGTAFVLADVGEIELDGDVTPIVFEEGVGPVPVRIEARDGRPLRTQLTAAKPPELGPAPPGPPEIAAALSLELADLALDRGDPGSASCGLPFLFVELRDREALGRARLQHAEWERSIASTWAPNIYVFTSDAERATSDLRARMFAPLHGVEEDPATGSAAAALAGILGPRDPEQEGTLRFTIEQGFEMGRPSLLALELDKRQGEVTEVRVAGASVLVSEGEMEIPG